MKMSRIVHENGEKLTATPLQRVIVKGTIQKQVGTTTTVFCAHPFLRCRAPFAIHRSTFYCTDTHINNQIAQRCARCPHESLCRGGCLLDWIVVSKHPIVLIVLADLYFKPSLRFFPRLGNSPCDVHGCSVILVFEFRNTMNYWFPRYW